MDNLFMNRNVLAIYEKLNTHYGDLKWWPAKTPYEMIVGAVLTQNTAWSNVEKAIANFGDNLTPQFVLDADIAELAVVIRSAGFFNQKAAYLKAVTAWFGKYNFDVPTVQREPLEKLRPELLSIKGIGKETADSILLYAFGFPTFVIDAYTMRLCGRYPINAGGYLTHSRKKRGNAFAYDTVKAHFEANLPRDVKLYNNYHAGIVYLCKDFCRKSKPLCDKCPLWGMCERIGLA
ncbi:MAG: endonuclease [Defluviitaleaceae bacterium]|nr:endonuclease [Defluviitaleaceae bacterium]MCL2238402.1 endonuclease [Defluviitaleaceae bacterium]